MVLTKLERGWLSVKRTTPIKKLFFKPPVICVTKFIEEP